MTIFGPWGSLAQLINLRCSQPGKLCPNSTSERVWYAVFTDKLELVSSVPEELWTKVCNTVEEAMNKTIPKKKKSKKAKWLPKEALQIDEEQIDKAVKNKGERERSVQFSSVAQLHLTLCDPMTCSTPGLPVHHQLPEFTQTHVH